MMITSEVAELVDGHVFGDAGLSLSDVAPLNAATRNEIAYFASETPLPVLRRSQAGAVLIGRDLVDEIAGDATMVLIAVDNPQAAFIQVMLQFRPLRPRASIGVSPLASVSPTALVGPGCNIYPGAYIGEGVVLGARCDIGPGAVIGDGSRLGDDVTIHANAVLYHDVRVGARSVIYATAVIGADGFGYRLDEGRLLSIPHTGTVVIEEDVDIGAGTTVDRAMIGETVIGAGTKLDNQVMIAHNCVVGKHNAFASQVGLAGSVTTGDYVQCGGQVGVANHSHIGARCAVGGKAGVSGVVPDGQRYAGLPARPEKQAVKAHLALGKLPEMRIQLRELTAQVQALQTTIDQLTAPSIVSKAA